MFVFVGVTIVVNKYHHPKEGKGLFGDKRVYLVYAFTSFSSSLEVRA